MESPTPPVKASTARHQEGLSSGTVRHQDGLLATQTDMDRCLAKVSTMVGGPFSDWFCARASPAVWDRANTAFSHTTRSDLVAFPPTEPLGCLAETSAEADSLISGELGADEPPSILGKTEIQGDRALIGLELSNHVLSPPRIGFEEWGAPGGDEGGRV